MDLDELKRLLEVATPAPWDIATIYQHEAYNKERGRPLTFVSSNIATSDTRLICLLRNAAPQLIQELEAYRTHYDALNKWMAGAGNNDEVRAARSRVEEIRRKG